MNDPMFALPVRLLFTVMDMGVKEIDNAVAE